MSISSGRSAASAMVFAGITARNFCGMAAQYSNAYNAAWLCPLLGLVFCTPLALTLKYAGDMGGDSPWRNLANKCPAWLMNAIGTLFALLQLADCATFMGLTASTANFTALSDVSFIWLILPLAVLIFAVVLSGQDAEGNSVRIWLKILPLLFIIVCAVQFKSYHPAWLAPIFGGGAPAIAQGALYCGGWTSLLLLPWLTAVPDKGKNRPLRPVLFAHLAASMLLLFLQMLCPSLIKTNLSQMARVEIILNNNRVSHVLQMLTTLIWFGSLLHLIAIEALSAASLLANCLPKATRWSIALVCTVASTALCLCGAGESVNIIGLYRYLFIVVGGLLSLLMFIAFVKTKGAKTCAL